MNERKAKNPIILLTELEEHNAPTNLQSIPPILMNLSHLFHDSNPQEAVQMSCPHCDARLSLDPVARITDTIQLERLFAGELNTVLCKGCLGVIQFEPPLLIEGSFAEIRSLMFVPLHILEEPQNLSYLGALANEIRVCHSMDELVRMVSVELLLVRHRQSR